MTEQQSVGSDTFQATANAALGDYFGRQVRTHPRCIHTPNDCRLRQGYQKPSHNVYRKAIPFRYRCNRTPSTPGCLLSFHVLCPNPHHAQRKHIAVSLSTSSPCPGYKCRIYHNLDLQLTPGLFLKTVTNSRGKEEIPSGRED
jgi:hypothetical protein